MVKASSSNGAANASNPPQQNNKNKPRPLSVTTNSSGLLDQRNLHRSIDGSIMSLDEDEAQKLENIRTPHDHDVLCGRGGGTNNHVGNERFRDFVNNNKRKYLNSSKREKPLVSRQIVLSIRSLKPPGRFLQKDERTGFWSDIGDQKAREKTSQALREGAPDIRKEMGVIDPTGLVPADHKKKMQNMSGSGTNSSLSPAALARISSNASTSSRGAVGGSYHMGPNNVMSGPASHLAGQHFGHQGRNPEHAYRDRTHLNNLNKMEAASGGNVAHTAPHMSSHAPESQYLAMHLQQKLMNGGHNPYQSPHPHHLASPHAQSQQFSNGASSAYYGSNMHAEEQQRYPGHPGHPDIPRPMPGASRQSSITSQYHYPPSAPASSSSSYSQHPSMPPRLSPVSHVDNFHSPPGSGQQYPPSHLQQQHQHGGAWGGPQVHTPSQGRHGVNQYYLQREMDYTRGSISAGRPLENMSSPPNQHSPYPPSNNQDQCKHDIDKAAVPRGPSPSDTKKSLHIDSQKPYTLPSCPEEFKRRLVEDNSQTRNIANGSIDLKRTRNQIDIAALYLDAGIMGIDPSKIASKIEKGVSSDIVFSEVNGNGESNTSVEESTKFEDVKSKSQDHNECKRKKVLLNNFEGSSNKRSCLADVSKAPSLGNSATDQNKEVTGDVAKSKSENEQMVMNISSSASQSKNDTAVVNLNLVRKELILNAKKFKCVETTLEAMGVS
eukprot:CAMPEP_0194353872 /NCGR_PEP_ID=MMETSP0174-20130528/2081_1 /TAXON_ID=216777 /ORGANISM="Proboscia alata, Strain PI-D3" /LENGTH=718 /DNA_ID=CAMNT_0039122569 /DNA_START=236 /DNA_END=2392 /DNA_ORIENTATION=+